jgi:hypothetical protein
MIFLKIRQQKGLRIARNKRLESFVKLLSKNSISGATLYQSFTTLFLTVSDLNVRAIK